MYTTRGKYKMSGKKPSHRNAIIKSQLIELIRHGHLQTTKSKARILKAEFDKLVNTAKANNETSRRQVMATLNNELTVEKLYSKVLGQLSDSNSGYTKSANTLPRKGDNAPQVIVMIKGTELEEKKSRLASTLERQEKKAEAEPGVAGKIRQAVTRGGSKQATRVKDTKTGVGIRRNAK